MRLPVTYSRLCLLSLFCNQAMSVVFLWERPDGFGSQALNRMLGELLDLSMDRVAVAVLSWSLSCGTGR